MKNNTITIVKDIGEMFRLLFAYLSNKHVMIIKNACFSEYIMSIHFIITKSWMRVLFQMRIKLTRSLANKSFCSKRVLHESSS